MKKEVKEMLIAKGREDLVEIEEINDSGYAGILPFGGIVSRLQYPHAHPIPENFLLNIPKPKRVGEERTSDYICFSCGEYFLTESQIKESIIFSDVTFGVCGICDKNTNITNISNYNYLKHSKYYSKENMK